ncbi:hypothetical protein [Pelagibius sp. Alg239-R121]|uniref:hypothetical protein n=1 Tax=Pelagibius sp. Alg239-R121 TaxID=2993448 RepID=UPI0024A6AA93|nr:hypothetical protein [Pelagibius sp. Alg239-R121]
MILIVENGIDYATYMNVHVLWTRHQTVAYRKKHWPSPRQRICWIGWDKGRQKTDLANMSDGETLYIAGHGDGRTVGLYKADKLAGYLIDHGIKKSIDNIKLLACKSALSSNPFNELLATELFSQSDGRIEVKVTGFPGDMTRNLAGKFRTMADGVPKFDALEAEMRESFDSKLEEAQTAFMYEVLNYEPRDEDDLLRKANSVTDQYNALGAKHSTYCPDCRRSLEQSIDNCLLDNKDTATRSLVL